MQSGACTCINVPWVIAAPRVCPIVTWQTNPNVTYSAGIDARTLPLVVSRTGEGDEVGALPRRHRSLNWNAHKPQVGIRQIHANRFPRPARQPLPPSTSSPMTTDDCAGRRRSQTGAKASLRTVLSRRLWPRNSIQRLCCQSLKILNTRPWPNRADGAFLHSARAFCVCYWLTFIR